LAPHFVVAYIE